MTLVFLALMVVVLLVVVPHCPWWAGLLIGAGQGFVCAFGVYGWWAWRRRRNEHALERLAELRRGQYAGGK